MSKVENHKPVYGFAVNLLSVLTKPFVRLRVTGLENIPKSGGAILALNHISLLDPVLAGVALRGHREVRALAKESLFRARFIGGAMSSMGHIPVYRGSDRAKDSLKAAVIALQAGELVGIYPEGTIPETLGEVGEFKTGAARLALESGYSVIPIASWGAQEVLPRNGGKLKALFRAILRRPVHEIAIGEPMGPFTGDPEDRERALQVTEEIRAEVLRLFTKLKAKA